MGDEALRILLLEDNKYDAELIQNELSKSQLSYTSKRVWNKESFANEIEEFQPDIILADFNLPEFNAIEALAILKNKSSRIPLILVTGSLGEELAVRCIRYGAVDYVLKQNLARLPTTLLNVVQRSHAEAERERAQDALRRSEVYFRSLIEKNTDIIAVMNSDASVRYVSPAVKQILGYEAEELVGKTNLELIHPDDMSKLQDAIALLQSGPDQGLIEIRVNCKNGTLAVLEVRMSDLLENPAINGIVVNAHDITDRVVAEESRKELEDQFHQIQKIEVIGKLAAGIAHDFNNILTAIQCFAEVLQLKIDQNSSLHTEIKGIQSTVTQGMQLIHQLLTFSSKQDSKITVINVNDTVLKMGSMLHRLIGDNVQLKLHLDPALDPLYADESQIQQVLMNLAVNARDAMPGGGELLIETSNGELGEGEGQHGIDGSERYIMIRVTDTGVGMDETTRSRIFEPFFTTKGSNGTGLGLSTVYGIIKQNEGHIVVTSQPGLGTVFTVYLPVDCTADENAVSLTIGNNQNKSDSKSILFVEDYDILQSSISALLRMNGFRVLAAGSAEDAIALFNDNADDIHLLITDITLPQMSGTDLAKTILARNPSIRVICISGWPQEKDFDSIVFLPKPVSMTDLLSKIREVMNSE